MYSLKNMTRFCLLHMTCVARYYCTWYYAEW